MKKTFLLLVLATLFSSFATPLFAVAAECQLGYVERSDGTGCDKITADVPPTSLSPNNGAGQQSSGGINTSYVKSYGDSIRGIINTILVPVLIALAFIVFLWGVYRFYIYGADNETERAKGHQFILWGVIGFVVIFSLWGLVNIASITFGLSGGTAPPFPTIGPSTGSKTGSLPTAPSNPAFGGVRPSGTTGTKVYNSSGAVIGTVDAKGNIVQNGQVVGKMQNGYPVTPTGVPISGATLEGWNKNGCADPQDPSYTAPNDGYEGCSGTPYNPEPTTNADTAADVDSDGVANNQDPDIDGDGTVNNADPDADGDGTANTNDSTPDGADEL